jgi:nicotinate-nucleotide adenylyltransferase
MRIGLLGGTFDPVHLGHLIMAEQARVELGLERIIFVLTSNPPHKPAAEISPVAHRLAMLNLALANHPQFEVSTVELERPGISYTVDTLRHFRCSPDFAEAELYLIIGADNILELNKWKEPYAIVSMARLAVYPRPGIDVQSASPKFLRAAEILHGPQFEISASDIRWRCSQGLSIRYFVLEEVREYILRNHLYEK